METLCSVKQQQNMLCIPGSRDVSKHTDFDRQAKSTTEVDDDLQRERPNRDNIRLQAWAENALAIHATAVNDKTSHADELNA